MQGVSVRTQGDKDGTVGSEWDAADGASVQRDGELAVGEFDSEVDWLAWSQAVGVL